MDVQRALLLLRRWWPVLVVGTLLAAGASYAVSKAQPKVYQATAVLQVNPGLPTSGGGSDFNELQAASWLAATDAQLIKSSTIANAVLTQTSGKLQHPIGDAGTLIKNTTATALPQNTLIDIAVRASTPQDAALLAQTIADDFVKADQQKRASGINADLNNLSRQILSYGRDLAQASYQYNQLLRKPSLSPVEQDRLTALSGQVTTYQDTLAELRARQTLAQAQLDSPGATTSVASPAQASATPVSPRTTVNVAVAAVLVFLALLGIAVLTDLLDTRPRSAAEVASALDLPLAGTIDAMRGGAPLAAVHDPAGAQTDAYRLLRATLGLTGDEDGAPSRTLVVTGATPGSGATNVAANLAAVTARAGTRVALVDANLRRPALHMLFDLPEGAGLATLLRDGDDPAALLRETPVPGLRLLPAGVGAATAIDLLDSARMRAALTALQESADLVVVDTGAATLPDTAALARLSDLTLLVARQRDGDRATLAAVAERLRLAGAPLGGVVVTHFAGPGAPYGAPRPAATAQTEAERAARTSARLAK